MSKNTLHSKRSPARHVPATAQAGFCGLRNSAAAWRLGLAVLSVLAGAAGVRAADPKTPPPPPPLVVAVEASPEYTSVPVTFRGVEVDPKTQNFWNVERKYAAPLLPACGQPLVFQIAVSAEDADHVVRVDGAVTDYRGTELAKVGLDIAVAKGATATRTVTVTPTREQSGPFCLKATWREAAPGTLAGTVSVSAGQANWRTVIQDFEPMTYPEPGGPLESAAAAAHRGSLGLLVRFLPGKEAKTAAPANDKPITFKASLPLDLPLAGRPVRLGFWIRTPAALTVSLRLHDPGIEVKQSQQRDAWVIGPLAVPAGDWRYVELPMPGYGRPLAERNAYGEPNGVVDYPLTADGLDFEAPPGTEVAVDDVDLWTEGEEADALELRAAPDKPAGLLYRDDVLNLVVANRWLWDAATNIEATAHLEDIRGARWPLHAGKVTVPAGGETVLAARFKDLPFGAYRLVADLKQGTRQTRATGESQFMVYEPGGGHLPPRELRKRLLDRNWLVRDLGFGTDIVLLPWHSVDNSPSVEPRMGLWTFDWLAPEIQARRDAGIEVIGRLGFTPLWADPTATWNKRMRSWYGSTTGMPSRDVFWEEYVLRTVDRFAGSIKTWVVWDRPDSGALGATPEEYAERLVSVAAAAARQADPGARVISGGIARENIEKYLLALAETGMAGCLDGIGILPTTMPLAPEDGYLDVLLARAQRIREQERLKPELVVLGLGWGTGNEAYSVSEFEQALYVPRGFILCRGQGIRQIHLQADEENGPRRRDSAAFFFQDGGLFGLKPAALSAKTVRAQLDEAEFLREIALNDRQAGVSRAFLFRRADRRLLLAAWRREEQSVLPLPVRPETVTDLFGNVSVPDAATTAEVTLRPDPVYILFPAGDPNALARQLERAPLRYTDAPESAWKSAISFHLDVGDAADEKAAGYKATDSRNAGPIDSHYFNDYGRRVVDSGRQIRGEESFTVPVSGFGAAADLLLRRRLDYSLADQRAAVYCNGQLVGQWFTWKRDARYRWRDTEFIVPNRFFQGKPAADIRVVAEGGEFTSYYYWAGPLAARTVFLSDLSLLVGTSGYGPGIQRDKNILGGALKFFRKPEDAKLPESYAKGLGTNGAANLTDSLVVVGMNQQYKRFRATVGIDAAADGRGSVRFRVHDGLKTLWDSKDMTYYSSPQEIDIDVSDAVVLMLWTGDSGDGNRDDLANWANARLELK